MLFGFLRQVSSKNYFVYYKSSWVTMIIAAVLK